MDIRQSVHWSISPSVFHFQMLTWVNFNWFSPNLVCALIFFKSGLGLLMGKFHQILIELSAQDTPIISFPDDNLSKHQWIFTKLGMCIDIVEICIGIANGQTLSNFDGVFCPYFRFRTITWVNVKGFQPNLVHTLIWRRSGLGLLMGKFHLTNNILNREKIFFSWLRNLHLKYFW